MLLIDKGKEVLHGSLEEIRRASSAGSVIRMRFSGPYVMEALRRQAGVLAAEVEGEGKVVVRMAQDASPGQLLRFAALNGGLEEAHTETMSLHDIYVKAVTEAR